MNQYVNSEFSLQYKLTNKADFLSKDLNLEGNSFQLKLLDTAGADRFHSIDSSLLRCSGCCVFVCDLTDPKTFESIEIWRNEFLNKLNPIEPDTFPFVLLGNKCDKIAERKVQASKIKQYCETKSNMPYFEISAKNKTNIEAAFEEVTNLAFKRGQKGDERFFANL